MKIKTSLFITLVLIIVLNVLGASASAHAMPESVQHLGASGNNTVSELAQNMQATDIYYRDTVRFVKKTGGRRVAGPSSKYTYALPEDGSTESQYQTDLSWNNEVADLVNSHRIANGLSRLIHVTAGPMFIGSNVRANETIERFSHTRPDGSDCWTAYRESGFQFEGAIAAENIAKAYQSTSGLAAAVKGFDLLKASPSHNRNMLNPDITHMSFGLIYDAHTGYMYNVHFFAKPSDAFETEPLQLAVFRAGDRTSYLSGQSVSLAARAEGGTKPYRYQFYADRSSGARVILRNYAASNIFSWNALTPDTYRVGVNVMDAQGNIVNQEKTVVIEPVETQPLTVAVFRAGWKAEYVRGEKVALAARGEGGTTPYQYQFYVYRSNGAKVILSSYRSSNVFTWIPLTADTYRVCVAIRDASGTVRTMAQYVTVR